MADADLRKERFQGNAYEREEDGQLHERYLKMKKERDVDKSQDTGSRINLEDAVDIVGTCDMMCPEFESLQRYFERDLDHFEKSPTGAYDRSLMVQTFARAAAGNDLPPSEDIRPPPILRVTIDYLLDNILVQHGIEATHNFIWNRTRAVRSDLTRQRDHSADAIYCLERIVRYHILSLHVVCRGQREIETLEIEQLKKALQSLTEVYHDARRTFSSPNEPEFRGYYILMHIRSRHAPFTLRNLPPSVYNSPILQWALRLRFSVARNTDGADEHNSDVTQMDYTGFFELVSHPSTSYLTACLLEAHFDDIRRQICLMMGLTLKNTSRSISLAAFALSLRLDSAEDALGWLAHLKWNVSNTGIVEIPQSRKMDVLIPPVATATPYPRPRSRLVRAKREVNMPSMGMGALDSYITQSRGSTFGKGYISPAIQPPRRRPRVQQPAFAAPSQSLGFFPNQGMQNTLPIAFAPPNPFGPSLSARPVTQPAPPKPMFNPFGPRPNMAMTNSPAPQAIAPITAFGAPRNETAMGQSPAPVLGFQSRPAPSQPAMAPSFQSRPVPVQQPASFFPTVPSPQQFHAFPQPVPTPAAPQIPQVQQRTFSFGTQTTPSTAHALSSSMPIPYLAPAPAPTPASISRAASFQPPATAGISIPLHLQGLGFVPTPDQSDVEDMPFPTPQLFPPPPADADDDVSINTTPPARPFDLKPALSEGYSSAASSILPASTRADAHESPPIDSQDLQLADTRSNLSSDTDAGLPMSRKADLSTRAEEFSRLSTLRSSVHQWRETVKDTKKPPEVNPGTELAEESARNLSLGARFINSKERVIQSPFKKRITHEYGATQDFMEEEKAVEDRKRIFAPGTFSRIISQTAKRRAGDRDLPPGWQTWISFVPKGGSISEWLKIKLAGESTAADLSKIIVSDESGDFVAAPGLIVLHIDPRDWDGNLQRAQELLDLLPGDSPYRPGLLLVMVANETQKFPKTWVSKLDRMLSGVVMDRKAVVFTSIESAQGLDAKFLSVIKETRFDIEGLAKGLDLKEVVFEYLSWWQMEFQYGNEQAFQPTLDLNRLLLVISVLMSGLDEFLRQVLLHCQISETDIPFNNFQSRNDIEGACIEMLDYFSMLGGDVRGFPITTAAILEQPDVMFKILFNIADRLKDLILEHGGILHPRAGLRRTLLQRYGREYNAKLEQELAPIDRSSQIYALPVNGATTTTPEAHAPSLKRKRSSIGQIHNLQSEDGREDTPSSLKRSRTEPGQEDKTKSKSKSSFKVQTAKARLNLRILQAVDIGAFSDEDERNSAIANEFVKIAEPLLNQLISSEMTQDKVITETRAILELIEEAKETIFDKICENTSLAQLILQLGHLQRLSSNLEFRELQAFANRFV